MGLFRRFRADSSGNFAIIVALSAIPLVGFSGLAIDYSRSLNARTYMQDRSDAISLAVAAAGPTADSSAILRSLVAQAQADYRFGSATFEGSWTSLSDYTVDARSKVPLTLGSIIPGVPGGMDVSTRSVTRYLGAKYVYKPPAVTQLDPEAGDYNRVSAYCFDPLKTETSTKGRSQMTDVADNGGTKFQNPMPRCLAGEMLSFRLYNSRSARGTPANWYKPSNEHYEYYTDTKLTSNDVEQYDLGGWAILETVMCPSLEKCVGVSKGGVLPEGKNRTPQRTTERCAPGKFMYYGWEDRPPGRGTSDKDYDDIRVIIECPTVIKTGDETVRLIQ